MAFIASTNFDIPPYNLFLLNQANSFSDFCTVNERDELTRLLGHKLYDAFVAGLAVVSPATPDQRWIDLRDGVAYTYLSHTYKWKGMVKMLTPYIYSMWTRDTFQFTTQVTVVQAKVENGQTVSPERKIVQAYNDYKVIAGDECNLKDTLFGYLKTSGTKYLADVGSEYNSIEEYLNEWFKDPGTMNVFNI